MSQGEKLVGETTGPQDETGPGEMDELIAVAHIVKTRGIKGEVVADILTDFPERFEWLEKLISVHPNGKRETLEIEDFWLQGGRIVFKFAGYDTPEAARELVKCELAVPEDEAVELEEDEFYDWELQGCRVETVMGESIGRVREVMRANGNELLVVDSETEKGRDYLIPFVSQICVEVDVENKLIRIDPPEGLLDL
jgi:16S rRNA processing protein RimM